MSAKSLEVISKNRFASWGGPKKQSLPPRAMKVTRSHRSTLAVAWVTRTMVRPCSESFFKSCIIFLSSPGSSPEVGSSRKKSFGSANSSTPMLTRFRWPPLSLLIKRFSRPFISISFRVLPTTSPMWVSGGKRSLAA